MKSYLVELSYDNIVFYLDRLERNIITTNFYVFCGQW